MIFLFIKILLSCVISPENANFISPLLNAKISLSPKFNFNPACPEYVDVYSFPSSSV